MPLSRSQSGCLVKFLDGEGSLILHGPLVRQGSQFSFAWYARWAFQLDCNECCSDLTRPGKPAAHDGKLLSFS